jgi:3,4-dihydroxy 2-butanone 4-phosphate synthase/GTP cyclohydrolase II
VRSARLLTNNPAKVTGLAAGGVDITGRVPLASAVTPYNLRYLITKRDRLGHDIQDLDTERVPSPPSSPFNGRPAAPHPVAVTAPAAEPA